MKVTSVRLLRFRSFEDSGEIPLGPINVLVGPNNSGKSSVLRGIHHLQHGVIDTFADVRVGHASADIDMQIHDWPNAWSVPTHSGQLTFKCRIKTSNRRTGELEHMTLSGEKVLMHNDFRFQPVEPNHYIVPFLSKRKATSYAEDVREEIATRVTSDMGNIAAKLSRLSNPQYPGHRRYAEACEAILGFVVSSVPSINGQRAGYYLPNGESVPVDQMGDGVPSIVWLLSQLVTSSNKLFLIEEPENDLHPQALKALLELIITSSASNQFVVSTHSNIVVSHLCAAIGSTLFSVSCEKGKLPTTSEIEIVPATPEARIRVLQELGYAFSDYDLWDGWLVLEESSAERIIRDYLVPWFVPVLARIRTVSAGGITKVEPAFDDLHRVMIFIHLQPAYAGRAWIRVDGGTEGQHLISKLQTKFPTVRPEHFATFDQEQFEMYYPDEFRDEVNAALAITDKQEKREAKQALLKKVIEWLDADPGRGKAALEKSADRVIASLKQIADEFSSLKK